MPPELELLRHLRNGVSHGNTFRINLKRLAKYPAHNRLAWVRSDSKAEFEITPKLENQPVLFDFMGPGDILDLLSSVWPLSYSNGQWRSRFVREAEGLRSLLAREQAMSEPQFGAPRNWKEEFMACLTVPRFADNKSKRLTNDMVAGFARFRRLVVAD